MGDERRPVDDMLNDVLGRAALDSPPFHLRGKELAGWYAGRDATVDFIRGEMASWLDTWELIER
jgi:hypothetical protein